MIGGFGGDVIVFNNISVGGVCGACGVVVVVVE